MPGIRIEFPTGEGWEYSLDNRNWQAQPVFARQPDGNALVAGKTYPVWVRHLGLGKLGTDSIILGVDSNSKPKNLLASLPKALRYSRGIALAPHLNTFSRQFPDFD